MFDRERVVFLNGFLGGETLACLTGPIETKLHELAFKNPSAPIMLCITSPGGHLASSYGFFDRIKMFGPKNLECIALDDVSSAALFLFIAGQKRFVTPHTTFFVHRLRLYIDEYSKNVASVCKKHITPDSIISLMTEKGTELTAQDALNMGLAHQLLSSEQEHQLRAWRDA